MAISVTGMTAADTKDRDRPINVHDGCTLLPFTLIRIGEHAYKLRYTISAMLELEQTLCRSLWTIMEQALIGTLGEFEQAFILHLGLPNITLCELESLLDTLARSEATRAFKQSQLELTRAIGHEVVYDDHGNPIRIKPRTETKYKKADVRDTEAFSQKKPQLTTFSQWYETALNTLFQAGVTMPIDEIMMMMPIELEAYFSAHDRRLIYLQKMAILEAWHAGAFTGKALSDGQMPELEPILRRIDRQSDKETQSKFTRDEAQAIIDQDKQEAAYAERKLRERRASNNQAKQSEDGEKKEGDLDGVRRTRREDAPGSS